MVSRDLMPLFLLWLGLTFPLIAQGQICDGNLGENIFTEGDFGSGDDNILLINPNIAPGYDYTTSPPPFDGYYLITNDIAKWSNGFDWLQIQDNSDDPEGYMMVVNASFEPGLFYEQEVSNLCEGTEYVFTADIHNLHAPNSNNLKPSVSFLLDGVEYYNTGLIDETGSWNTYGFSFSTEPGQTSVVLSLRNNAAGGIGNDLALDNISFQACGPAAEIQPGGLTQICSGADPIEMLAALSGGSSFDTTYIQWQQSFDRGPWENIPGATGLSLSHTHQPEGLYRYRYLLANSPEKLDNEKCRIISEQTAILVWPNSQTYLLTDTICEGQSYSFGSRNLSQTGVYLDSLVSQAGCDSIMRLELTVTPAPAMEGQFIRVDPSCQGAEDGSIQIIDVTGGNPPYNVTYAGDPVPFLPYAIGQLGEGTYEFSLYDRFGCRVDTLISLVEPARFTVELGPDQEVIAGEALDMRVLATHPIVQFSWEPSELIDCVTDCEQFSWTPFDNTEVKLVATSERGCVASDSFYVQVRVDRFVSLPNAFSPNGDGDNDFFTVFGKTPDAQELAHLAFYNRWGQQVASMENIPLNVPESGWDGTYAGRPVPQGVYMCVARVRFWDGLIVPYATSVTLTR